MSDAEKWPEDFIDFDNIITKDAEFTEVYEAFRNGRIETQKILLYFNIALEEAEEELARNPDSVKMQQRKIEINDYLAKIHRILGMENPSKEAEPVITGNLKNDDIQDISGIDSTFLYFPEFKKDYQLLKKHNYINIENGKLTWKKSKKSLAEYFGNQGKKGKKIKWSFIEHLFNVDNLKNSFSTNGSSYDRKKTSKDYEKWLELKNTPKGK